MSRPIDNNDRIGSASNHTNCTRLCDNSLVAYFRKLLWEQTTVPQMKLTEYVNIEENKECLHTDVAKFIVVRKDYAVSQRTLLLLKQDKLPINSKDAALDVICDRSFVSDWRPTFGIGIKCQCCHLDIC